MEIKLALIICKEGQNRDNLTLAATRCRLNPICCSNLDEAWALLVQGGFKVVLCEDVLPDGDIHVALRMAKETADRAPVIVISQGTEWNTYLQALSAGAFDYILFPTSLVETERVLKNALADATQRAKAARMAA